MSNLGRSTGFIFVIPLYVSESAEKPRNPSRNNSANNVSIVPLQVGTICFWVNEFEIRIFHPYCVGLKTDFWWNPIAWVQSQHYLLIFHSYGCQGKFCWKEKIENFPLRNKFNNELGYFRFDQMGPFKIGGSIKAMFLLVGLLLDVFERLRIDWHKIGPDLRELLRSKYQIWLFQRQFLAIILSVLPTYPGYPAWYSLIKFTF